MSFSIEQVVTALYRGVLGREPDPDGFKDCAEMLACDPDALDALAARFYESDEHRTVMKRLLRLRDHSQYGEFPIVLRRLLATGQRHGIIVDVGARGRDRSNSYDLLSQFGWKGFLVEANPMLHESIEADFAGTDFSLIRCAVGVEDGKLPLYIGANDDVSSLLQDHAASWGDLKGTVEVQVRRLSNILNEFAVPVDFDVLSLDIEGLDVPVLNDLIDNSRYRPAIVIIEASYNFSTQTLSDVLASQAVDDAYEIIGQTDANLILGLKLSPRG